MQAEPTNNNVRIKEFLWNQMPLIALIVLCIIAALVSNRFLSPININNVLMQGAVITVIAIGMTYVIVCGGFDLSVGSVAALSGCVCAMVMLEYGHRRGDGCRCGCRRGGRSAERSDRHQAGCESVYCNTGHDGNVPRRDVPDYGRAARCRR